MSQLSLQQQRHQVTASYNGQKRRFTISKQLENHRISQHIFMKTPQNQNKNDFLKFGSVLC